MRKLLLIISLVLLLNISMASAHEHSFDETKQLIDSVISCDELTEEQLEAIGDYYMEQMHSGEQHEIMDNMMGGEDSESLRQMHIQMARVLYCGESGGMTGSGGMMGIMNITSGQAPTQTNMMQKMMGNWGYSFGYWNFINIVYAILLIGLIILVYLGIIKLRRGPAQKKNKGVKK